LSKCTKKEQLPSEACAYIEAIENMSGVPVSFVSVGPEREQTIAFHEQVI
jgi:adenylosuccinate synthase